MNRRLNIFFLTLIGLTMMSCSSATNNIDGLWLMSKVTVGDQEMTPVAKWTEIYPDGTYESGNGWLKSSEGTWIFQETEQTFSPTETNGLADPYGAFEIAFPQSNNGESMTWTREEEGIIVEVTLSRIDERPKAPADKVQGLWDLTAAVKDGEDAMPSFDPNNQHYIFIRWDKIYVERSAEGTRRTGYWHMNAHSPEITLMSHNSDENPQTWSLTFDGAQSLKMTGLSESNRETILKFTRINQFPE